PDKGQDRQCPDRTQNPGRNAQGDSSRTLGLLIRPPAAGCALVPLLVRCSALIDRLRNLSLFCVVLARRKGTPQPSQHRFLPTSSWLRTGIDLNQLVTPSTVNDCARGEFLLRDAVESRGNGARVKASTQWSIQDLELPIPCDFLGKPAVHSAASLHI